MEVHSELYGHSVPTVKRCPPFVDAMAHGFVVPLPCDISIADGSFAWDWPIPLPDTRGYPRAPLGFHAAEQLSMTPLANGLTILKFHSFWTIQLEQGWSLFATHPVNREDLPFRILTGIVDADRFYDSCISFPAVWTDPEYSGVLRKGTPIAQCFPVRREIPELVYECLDPEHQAAYSATAAEVLSEPGVYRKSYRAKRRH